MKLPLRERKRARTRLALAGALSRRLDSEDFEQIAVGVLCDEAMISEATFFNYFPRKIDLLAYCARLWSVELVLRARDAAAGRRGLVMIERLFEALCGQLREAPGLSRQILAFLSRRGDASPLPALSPGDVAVGFPGVEAGDGAMAEPIEAVLRTQLETAIAGNELPSVTRVDALVLALTSLFHGVPLAAQGEATLSADKALTYQLNLLWLGARASGGAGLASEADRPSLHHRRG